MKILRPIWQRAHLDAVSGGGWKPPEPAARMAALRSAGFQPAGSGLFQSPVANQHLDTRSRCVLWQWKWRLAIAIYIFTVAALPKNINAHGDLEIRIAAATRKINAATNNL